MQDYIDLEIELVGADGEFLDLLEDITSTYTGDQQTKIETDKCTNNSPTIIRFLRLILDDKRDGFFAIFTQLCRVITMCSVPIRELLAVHNDNANNEQNHTDLHNKKPFCTTWDLAFFFSNVPRY